MVDTFKRVKNGEKLRIPARTYNAMVDAAQDFINRKNNFSAESGKPLAANMVYIKNSTGAAVDRFNILGISGSEINAATSSFQQTTVLTGVAPTQADHSKGRFVITAEPIASNSVGKAYVSGFLPLKINVLDELHTYADICNDDVLKLQTVGSGPAFILWKEQGTGIKWAIVKINHGSSEPAVIQWAKTENEAGSNIYIPARLYNWAGELDVYETFDPQMYPQNHIYAYCTICGTSPLALNQATPYLFGGVDIPVIQRTILINGQPALRWYCIWGFQKTYICGT